MKLATVFFAMAVAAAGSAFAQAPSGRPPVSPEMQAARAAVRQACEADIKSICADKQGREIWICLRSNNDKLSAGCKDAMSKLPPRPTTAQ